MKIYLRFFGLLLIVSLLFVGIACQPEAQNNKNTDNYEDYQDTIPLIYHMSFVQRYTTKLYLSGMAENWDLADIYAHELEEISETITESNYMDDDINISDLMASLLIPQLEEMEKAIDSGDKRQFKTSYQTLIQTCNQCHKASNYEAVKITTPESNPFNQDFSIPANK